jgi:subtilisin family serine protease
MPYSYKVAGQPVELEVDPSVVAVRFAPVPASAKASALMSAEIASLSKRIDLPEEGLAILPAPALPSPFAWSAKSGHGKLMAALEAEDAVEKTVPVFRFGACQAVPTDRVIIGVEPGAEIAPLLARHGLELISRQEERVLARADASADIFALVAALDAEPETLYAEPDFAIIGQHMPARPAGALAELASAAGSQYALAITRASEAHQVQRGEASIRVAILDEGVDTAHPDLAAATAATHDALDGDSYQTPNSWDGHGTACAGLAVGRPASGGGVTGVGIGASLVAVRLARSERKGGPWVTTPDRIAAAIDWAWQDGKADVLSNSWGQQLPTSAITLALERARTKGRGGLGCVVVVAAGNNGGTVLFPASLPNVLTVGASNQFDEAKTFESADKETYWASCRGPEIDVAAPGVQNLTTDITGTGGYDAGNYAPAFNGTSSATPIVAGACALLLSKKPALREAEVRQAIVATADKVGQFPYVNGRNDYMGGGRLNVLAAINGI